MLLYQSYRGYQFARGIVSVFTGSQYIALLIKSKLWDIIFFFNFASIKERNIFSLVLHDLKHKHIRLCCLLVFRWKKIT